MVALPGPRGPGSLNIDRELTAYERFIGLFDNGTAPSSCAGRRGEDSSTSRANFRGDAERVCRKPRMAAHIRRPSAGLGVSAKARPRARPPERWSRRRIHAGRRQRPACPAEIVAAELMVLPRNSGDRRQPPPAQKQSGRCHIRDDRRQATTKLRPSGEALRRQNSTWCGCRSRPRAGDGHSQVV